MNELISVIDTNSINFNAAQTKLIVPGLLSGYLWNIPIKTNKILGQRSAKSLVKASLLVRKITILIQNRIKINTGWEVYVPLITSTIFWRRAYNLPVYLSFVPEYNIKQILSKDLIFFFVYVVYLEKKEEAEGTLLK